MRSNAFNKNARLEAQAQRLSRGTAQTYLPTQEEPTAKINPRKKRALPFQHEEGRCPIEEARHAAYLAMQEALKDGAPMYLDTNIDASDCL
tara:strand:+ start:627 stop:899 length:273 start_codon:yes stop_codon:yes gene_type:complete